uniref:Uncharacterized protein n=1 Tax=Lepeophtheirus salmonis TaxID=72036 RepID=A0A0K2UGD2_LEPSM
MQTFIGLFGLRIFFPTTFTDFKMKRIVKLKQK